MSRKSVAAVVASVVGLVGAADAFRPFSRRGFSSLPAMFLGLLYSELPLPMLGIHLGAQAILSRGASRRTRLITWLLSGITALGLIVLDRIDRRSIAALNAALDESLGEDRPRDVATVWRSPAISARRAPGALRMMRIHRQYAHATDVSYGEYGEANLLDIWRLPDLDRHGRAPVLLQVPGGAWSIGNKQGQAHPLMSHLSELGWVCVSINYRLSPRHTWPDHIVDVKRAIAWVKDNIESYGGDPDFVTITGGSAGGHLSALAALTANDPVFQPGFTESDTTVQAAVPFYGVYDFTSADVSLHPMMLSFLEKRVMKSVLAHEPGIFQRASALNFVHPDAPPFFVLHGRNDAFIPVEQARRFTARLREVSAQPVAYAELPIAQHSFDILASPRSTNCAVAVGEFLAAVYQDAAARTGAERAHP